MSVKLSVAVLATFRLLSFVAGEAQTRPKHILRAIRQRCAARLCYEHAKAIHSLRSEPKAGPRQGAWYCFQWISTGVASIAKGGRPRLHLLTAAPPAAPIAPGTVHVRVAAVLIPAKGKRPTASAWAIEAHDPNPNQARRYHDRAPARERRHSRGGHTPCTGPRDIRQAPCRWRRAGRCTMPASWCAGRANASASPSRVPPRQGTCSRPAQARRAPRPRTAT